MSISRVNAVGWGVGEKLTSAQQNALDINVTYAADKRAAQTDTIEALWTLSGIGRIISTSVLGADANANYQADGGNSIVRVTSAVSANRTYTLTATNAQDGDRVSFYCETGFNYEITIRDQALATLFKLGNNSDGTWAEFIYKASGWRLYKYASLLKLRVQTFTSNGNWTAPGNVSKVFALGVGGGGGGGGGRYGYLTGYSAPAGSGGGGATSEMILCTVTPGGVYAVSLGAQGTAGIGSPGHGTLNDGGFGGDGGDTTFGSTLAVFSGAAGGRGASYTSGDFYSVLMASGTTMRGLRRRANYPPSALDTGLYAPQRSGDGGWGAHETANWFVGQENGARHGPNAGGVSGSSGSFSTNAGGHGGGGGGASNYPGSTAGAGGTGGNGSASSATDGTAGGAGTKGGGGGGGGAGGNGPTAVTGGGAGAGGLGGAGELTLIWFGS